MGKLPYSRSGDSYTRTKSKTTIPEEVVGYINTWAMNFRLAFYPSNNDTEQDMVKLSVSKGNATPDSRPLHLNLADLTLAEHRGVREFLNYALDMTEPIVAARDKAAKDAWRIDRDDTYYRQYRSLPNVVVRNGSLFQYIASFVNRSAYVPRVDREERDISEGHRATDDEVATGDEPSGSS